MNVVIFGATGMVGQGVLRECLLDPDVTRVVTVVRKTSGRTDPRLEEIVHADFFDYSAIEERLTGLDACFFAVGVTSTGTTEEAYTRITHDIPVAAAKTLLRLNAEMTFVFVSATGAVSSEKGATMWGRVKGRTENDLLAMPFKAVYVLRPGLIQPLHGIKSKTAWYRTFYAVTSPLMPLLRKMAPKYITTTEEVGKAMLQLVKVGYSRRVIEGIEIGTVSRGESLR
jgi:uncharacterized protein YbjT (DUF2867 family)